jgi:hypothetical protein
MAGGLHRQQLVVVADFDVQKQQAVITLMNLQLRGFTEKDIIELVLLVQSWNASGVAPLGTPGMTQGNGRGMSKKLDTKLMSVGN